MSRLILRETDTYVIEKYGGLETEFHVVREKKTNREFGIQKFDDAVTFANTEGWNKSSLNAVNRRIFRIRTLFAKGQLEEDQLLGFLNYARRYSTDGGFLRIYDHVRESFGEHFSELFEILDTQFGVKSDDGTEHSDLSGS